jgi:hypothetical protein
MAAKNGKRVLRSKKEPHIDKPALADSNIWSWAPDGLDIKTALAD